MTVTLSEFLSRIEKRKTELGILNTPERIEALRNRGARRTPEKRTMLKRNDERARTAGLEPLKAYY